MTVRLSCNIQVCFGVWVVLFWQLLHWFSSKWWVYMSCNIDDVATSGGCCNSWGLIFRNWITFMDYTCIDCWIIYNKLFNICLLIVMWCIAFKNAWISWNDCCSACFDLRYFTVLYFTLLFFLFLYFCFSLIFFVKTDLAIFIKILYCIYTY
jgi:hypothetical protein